MNFCFLSIKLSFRWDLLRDCRDFFPAGRFPVVTAEKEISRPSNFYLTCNNNGRGQEERRLLVGEGLALVDFDGILVEVIICTLDSAKLLLTIKNPTKGVQHQSLSNWHPGQKAIDRNIDDFPFPGLDLQEAVLVGGQQSLRWQKEDE